eukprot:PhM_4_TR11678/c0_g1_i3/m.13301
MSSTSTTSPIPSNAPNSVPYFVSPEMGQAQQPQVLHQQQQQPVFIFPSAGVAGDPNIAMQPQQQQPMFFVVNGPNGTLLPLQQGFMMPDGAAAAQPYFQASPMVAQHQHQQQPAVMVMMPQQQEQSPPQAQVAAAKADDDAKTAGELSKHHSSHSLLSTGHEQRPRRVASAGQAQLRDGISPQRSVRRQSLSHNQLPIPRQKLKIDSGLKLRCFYCRDVGHKAIHCPMNPEWSGELSALCVLHNKTRCMSSLRPHGDPSLGQYECLPDSACRRIAPQCETTNEVHNPFCDIDETMSQPSPTLSPRSPTGSKLQGEGETTMFAPPSAIDFGPSKKPSQMSLLTLNGKLSQSTMFSSVRSENFFGEKEPCDVEGCAAAGTNAIPSNTNIGGGKGSVPQPVGQTVPMPQALL